MYLRIPYDLEQKLDRELQAGESVIYKGMPIPRFFRIDTLGIFLFAIPWTAFAIFWMCGAAGFKIPDFSNGFNPVMLFPLFGLPFVGVGLAMLSAPFISYLTETKTIYAITNKRVIIISGIKTIEIQSFALDKLEGIIRRERGTKGDLVFSHKRWKDSDGDNRSQEIGFFNVPDVVAAQRILQKAIEKHQESLTAQANQGDWKLN